MMRKLLLAACGLLFALQASAADIVGKWRTIDDETGQPKSIVEIYQKGGKYYGRIVDLLMKPDDTLCEKCTGPLKGKPLVGMNVITGMVKNGEVYTGGEIMDPNKGKTYDCKLWLEGDDKLMVRGYLGFFYRTQTWYRAK